MTAKTPQLKRGRPMNIVRTKSLTQGQRTALIQVGCLMSNLLYNMKRSPGVPKEWRDDAAHLQDMWDEIRRKP